jgi:glycosyltransferase involved in cell wall biosynthesis
MTIPSPESLKVLMLPDCRDANPYQALLARSVESSDVEVIFPQGYKRIFPLFRAVLGQRTNVIHLHWILPYIKGRYKWQKLLYSLKLLLDIALVQKLGVRVVWTVHNQITHDTPHPQLELWLRRRLAQQVDRLILHSSTTSDSIVHTYRVSPTKAQVIPHGHYREVYPAQIDRAEARRSLGLPTTGNLYLSLGLLRPYKGVESLITLWREHPEIVAGNTLLIAGKASSAYAQELKKLTAGLPGVVFIPEFIENDRIHLFFSAATFTVLPYRNILNSGSLILAMSYGVPVIAPRLGSISESLGKADGLLYDAEDEMGLLKALKLSLEIDQRSLSQQVVEACDRLGWEEIGGKTKQIYEDVSVN